MNPEVAGQELELSRVSSDSRVCSPGTLFVAIAGTQGDGHQHVEAALKAGAPAVVVQKAVSFPTAIRVQDTRRALSTLTDWFFGTPSAEILSIGITGTNGKTTINWVLYHLMNALGIPTIRIGTLGIHSEQGGSTPGALTTPDPGSIHQALARAREVGCRGAVLETSSHALDQHRIDAVQFDVGVFTNLTRDHLDYHGTMERYYQAKELLIELLASGAKRTKLFVTNIDDPAGRTLANTAAARGLRVLSYGKSSNANLRIVSFEQRISGSTLVLAHADAEYRIASRYIGAHNAENLAAVFGVALGLSWDLAQVTERLGGLPMVPGRLEPVGTPRLGVYVDYAHSPDALEKVLITLRPLTTGKVWVVFGCGGDRDRGKRPQMAAIARKHADRVMVTSDNPRTEDPQSILNEILAGGEAVWGAEVDRRKAIQKVIRAADDGDVVLIAGKGHEDYQIIGSVKHHFSDQEEACTALALRDRGAACCV